MDKVILLTSIILFTLGIIGICKHNNIVRLLISIDIITLASIINFLCSDFKDGDLITLVIVTSIELEFAILFLIANKAN